MEMYHLNITLKTVKPKIVREVAVPCICSFAQLHDIINILFGWEGEHLYCFDFPSKKKTLVSGMEEDDYPLDSQCACDECLGNLLLEKDKFIYTYDFGDEWIHDITVVKVDYEVINHPYLIRWSGQNALEECGGAEVYNEMLKRKDPRLKNRNKFDEDYVELRFQEMELDEYEEEDYLENDYHPDYALMCDYLDDLYMLISEDTLIYIHNNEEVYPVLLVEGDSREDRCVYVFPSEDALAAHYYRTDIEDPSNFLFLNAFRINMPAVDAFEADDYFEPDETKTNVLRFANGEIRNVNEDEIQRLLELCEVFSSMGEQLTSEIDSLPSITNFHSMHLFFEGEELKNMDILPNDIFLQMPEFYVDVERAKKIKLNKTKKMALKILAIPTFGENKEDIHLTFYAATYHSAYEEMYHIKESAFLNAMQDLIDHLLFVFEQSGCPKYFEVTDARVFECLAPLMEHLPCRLRMGMMKDLYVAQLYKTAIEEENPELAEQIQRMADMMEDEEEYMDDEFDSFRF